MSAYVPSSAELEERLERLRSLLAGAGARSAVVERPEHVYYLTDSEPHRDYPAFLAVGMREVRSFWPDGVPEGLPPWFEAEPYVFWPVTDEQRARSRAAVEAGFPSEAVRDRIREPGSIFDELVRPKSAEEVCLIEENLRGNDAAFAAIADRFAPGASDLDIYGWTVEAMTRAAGEPLVWDGNIGLGAGGGEVEATARGEVAELGSALFVDLYPRRRHYAGDSSRCFAAGEPPDWAVVTHALLERAIDRVLELLRPGVVAGDLDVVCRSLLDSNDLGGSFPHHTGHGMGLFSQESPYLIPDGPWKVRAGDVIAIEPGLYWPGECGLRLEEVFEVMDDGARRMTSFPRRLTVCR